MYLRIFTIETVPRESRKARTAHELYRAKCIIVRLFALVDLGDDLVDQK